MGYRTFDSCFVSLQFDWNIFNYGTFFGFRGAFVSDKNAEIVKSRYSKICESSEFLTKSISYYRIKVLIT